MRLVLVDLDGDRFGLMGVVMMVVLAIRAVHVRRCCCGCLRWLVLMRMVMRMIM